MSNEANVWILDIETSPLVALIWETGKQYVNNDQVIFDWFIMSFSAKRLHDSPNKMVYMETRNGDDRKLLDKLWEIFNEADVIITQNGKKFDEPKIAARMMLNGFKPYKPFKHHDTFEQNTNKAFTSHSLAYLSEKFCTKYKKLKHKMFSGLSLWKECLGIKIVLNPNPKAWAEMRKYNNYDVLSDEELYLNTRGWSKKSAPAVVNDPTDRQCKYCSAVALQKRGVEVKLKSKYQRLQCTSCGKWTLGDKV